MKGWCLAETQNDLDAMIHTRFLANYSRRVLLSKACLSGMISEKSDFFPGLPSYNNNTYNTIYTHTQTCQQQDSK